MTTAAAPAGISGLLRRLEQRSGSVHVLLVGIDSSQVKTLTDALSAQRYQITFCDDTESGWHCLVDGLENPAVMPDLLLLDLQLPEMEGFAFLRRMRADERFALLPVITLIEQGNVDVRLIALEAGANDYISKPVQTLELLTRVKALLGWKLTERFQQQRLEQLVETGRILLSTHDLSDVLHRVMEIATIEIDAEGGTIWLKTPDGKLECCAAFGSGSEELMGMQLEAGQGVAGWSLQNRQSLLVSDAYVDPRFYEQIDQQIQFHTRDLVAVPLIAREADLGVLEMVNKRAEPFSLADLAWLEVLAPLAAAAIANVQLVDTLRQQTIELEARNQELDAFSRTVAHDLQNPLSIIVGFAEVLERDYDSIPGIKAKQYLDTVGRTSRKASSIVQELLLLAQVRKADVQVRPLDMADIVASALDQLAYQIRTSQADLVLPNAWPDALGYGPWIEEVWVNYIGNAIKYGGQPPKVILGAEVQPDGRVRFWVRDNGPGLAQADQDRLFTPFTQLDPRQSQGQGLGLSIVRRIIRKLDGQVGVESKLGHGSEFSFTLNGVADTENLAPEGG